MGFYRENRLANTGYVWKEAFLHNFGWLRCVFAEKFLVNQKPISHPRFPKIEKPKPNLNSVSILVLWPTINVNNIPIDFVRWVEKVMLLTTKVNETSSRNSMAEHGTRITKTKLFPLNDRMHFNLNVFFLATTSSQRSRVVMLQSEWDGFFPFLPKYGREFFFPFGCSPLRKS